MSKRGVQSIEQPAGSGTVSLDFGPISELENARLTNVAMKYVWLSERVKGIVRL